MNRSMIMQQMAKRSQFFWLGLLGLTLFASPVAAQVFDLGPSNPAFFDTVIKLPTDPNIGEDQSIGGGDLLIQLNIANGGSVGDLFSADNRSEVNISGGSVGEDFEANAGSEVNLIGGLIGRNFDANDNSTVNVSSGSLSDFARANSGSAVNISGGIVGFGFNARSGSVVNISGGNLGRSFDAKFGSDVELIGSDFQLNGEAFTEDTISLNFRDVFTGTLADGSTFVFNERAGDSLSNVQLTSVELPALDVSPIVVSTSNPDLPSGLRSGQTLRLIDGGELGVNFEFVGATLNVEGGSLGNFAAAANSTVNVSGGSIGENFEVHAGSEVNVNGGLIGRDFDANSGSVVNISGGSVSNFARANSGSVVNISGGTVGFGFEAVNDSVVTISGGSIGRSFKAFGGSEVELIGGEFQLDEVAVGGGRSSVLTGTLVDGSAFILSSSAGDTLDGIRLTSVALPALDLSTIVVSTPNPSLPSGLRPGQTLRLLSGGELGFNFEVASATLDVEGGTLGSFAAAANSTVNISGGSVGDFFQVLSGTVVDISGGEVGEGFEANAATVNISGGTVGDDFFAIRSGFSGSEINISGGTIGNNFKAFKSEINISGGNIGNDFVAFDGSEVNISGGSIGNNFTASFSSPVNISGGTIGSGIEAGFSSPINLFGSNFALDGVPLGLTNNQTFLISDRDATLSGLLADGSAFSWDLGSPLFDVSRLRVTLGDQPTSSRTITHEPLFTFDGDSAGDQFGSTASGAGDVNGDGIPDFIVGAPGDDNNGEDSGSARVFSGADGSTLYKFLGDSTTDGFGTSVSGAGDVNGDGFADLIVGAPGSDNSNARVFSGANGSILYNFSIPGVGFSVSGAGDVNGDGNADLIVGNSTDGQLDTGSARVLSGADGSVLYNFNGDSTRDVFGGSVSGAGDVNGDGFADLIVGAQSGFRSRGSAKVFSGADGSILHTFLESDNNELNDQFGFSVSGAGDVDGDGFADLIVGAPRQDVHTDNRAPWGNASVFSGSDGRRLFGFGNSTNRFSENFNFDGFGSSVSGAGDVNGDGFADLIVGAPDYDADGPFERGYIQIVSGFNGESISHRVGDSAGDRFGSSVSGVGDVNGDGVDDFIVGALNGGANNGGYARLFVSQITAAFILGDVDQNGVVDFADIAPFIEVLRTGNFLEQADCNQDGEVNFADISVFIDILIGA